MQIKDQTDEQLLKRGYHWKIAARKDSGRFAFATPITKPPTGFHQMMAVPKFYMPTWLALLNFRCFRVGWTVDRSAKFTAYLAMEDGWRVSEDSAAFGGAVGAYAALYEHKTNCVLCHDLPDKQTDLDCANGERLQKAVDDAVDTEESGK